MRRTESVIVRKGGVVFIDSDSRYKTKEALTCRGDEPRRSNASVFRGSNIIGDRLNTHKRRGIGMK